LNMACKGKWKRIPGVGWRYVKVLRSGQWRFMKSPKYGKHAKHRTARKSSRRGRHWIKAHWSR